MGSYGLETYFNGKTKNTPWVPFNINLRNCPAFFGTYTSDSNPPSYYTDNSSSYGLRTLNSISMTMTPTYGAINSGQGIINLDGAKGSAQGIGIQLASGSASNSNPALLNLAVPMTMTFASNGVSDQIIPLQARYIQTGSSATPGPANSKAIFTINYY